ncbi:hypothetical protein BH09MYX1_BH09MYX1_46710 [soil metagenome]
MSEALVQRWDGFLKSITDRFQQVMQESREGCAQLLADSDFDTIPMGNAWSAMERRAKELGWKIDETWTSQVEPKFEEAGVPRGLMDQQRAKGNALRDWIELEIERVRIEIYVSAFHAIAQRDAEERASNGPVGCTQCGAPLVVPHSFRALNVTCTHCRTVNSYEPGSRVRMGEASCSHSLCQQTAWNQFVAMNQAEQAYRRARPSTIQHIQAWEAAQIAYHRVYLTKRLELMPEQAAAFEKDLRGRMEHFYVYSIQNELAWIQAGRPRAPLI